MTSTKTLLLAIALSLPFVTGTALAEAGSHERELTAVATLAEAGSHERNLTTVATLAEAGSHERELTTVATLAEAGSHERKLTTVALELNASQKWEMDRKHSIYSMIVG